MLQAQRAKATKAAQPIPPARDQRTDLGCVSLWDGDERVKEAGADTIVSF